MSKCTQSYITKYNNFLQYVLWRIKKVAFSNFPSFYCLKNLQLNVLRCANHAELLMCLFSAIFVCLFVLRIIALLQQTLESLTKAPKMIADIITAHLRHQKGAGRSNNEAELKREHWTHIQLIMRNTNLKKCLC